ncbi:hypothetical protein F1D05_09545 [Kribbella qitaiheensis]|uniref:Uncharacterized protein n=1 Tax=Kribbella qitaiheensis TaxID=1544730 RepID=A0A7G6WVS0_9ACTN|nr:hypothetical protein [Kribbella qitaiheensis]QNE18085.1 hypothetical protein F1D05_09545 [Kribbella qitaiheensis]
MTIGLTLASASATARSTALAAQKTQIESLEARNSREAQRNAETSEKTGLEGLGISASRVKADSATIGQLLSIAFTWDSGDAYEIARTELQDRFDLSEKDAFFRTFMPPSRFNRDADGKRYYYIDAVGLNSALGRNTDTEVVAVTGTRYRYAVMADVVLTIDGSASINQPQPAVPRPTATRRVLVYVTLDARGRLSELAAIAASGSTRTSR